MKRKIHEFENGIKVYEDHLNFGQRKRYTACNVHEPDEEAVFIRIIRSIPENGRFVNIGSAIGYYAMLAKRISTRLEVHVYEPLQVHRDYFRENLLVNGFNPEDFSVHEQAVSGTKGRIKLINRSYGSQIASVAQVSLPSRFKLTVKRILNALKLRKYRIPKTTTVDTVPLDTVVNQAGGSIDLILMDIQGAEAEVLEGASGILASDRVRTFMIGTHGHDVHGRCRRALVDNGYTIDLDEEIPIHQSDGIIVASKACGQLLKPRGMATGAGPLE